MANMSSQGQMPTGAMQETVATAETRDTENLGHMWRATATKPTMAETVATAETRDTENLGHMWRATSAKPVMESTGEKMPGEADMEPTEHPETMPGE